MGRPLTYQQTFTATYQLPLTKLPIFDWLKADANYNSSYNWKRGATLRNGGSYGDNIANQRSLTLNGSTNFETLYNKVEFLKETNKKFSGSSSSSSSSRRAATPTTRKTPEKKPEPKEKKFSSELKLVPDSTYEIKHNQKSKRPEVSFRTQDGRAYKAKYKVVDENTIRFTARDSASIKLSVAPGPELSEQGWYKAAQYGARGLMMVRNASLSYKNTMPSTTTALPATVRTWDSTA